MDDLGHCAACNSKLAVIQHRRFRFEGDRKIYIDAEGKDLPTDTSGQPKGQIASYWSVSCPKCGREYAQHPYQKKIDAAAGKQKPPPPAFLDNRYSEITGTDALDRRITALESALALAVSRLEKQFLELCAEITALRDQRPASDKVTNRRK